MTRLVLFGALCGLCGQAALAADARLAVPGGAKVFDYEEARVYPVVATPGRITDIVLEPGEVLVGSGPIAAGDTARWVIGDTSSGAAERRRVHVMVKPTAADLATNLIINSDRRTYHLELRASARTWFSQVSWRYPESITPLVAAQPAIPAPPAPLDPARLNFGYRMKGDHPSWRPLRVFDDGRRAYVEFGPGIVLDDLPPLYRLGADGKAVELINYHVEGRRLVVDRLFDRAQLRMGLKRGEKRVTIIRDASGSEASR